MQRLVVNVARGLRDMGASVEVGAPDTPNGDTFADWASESRVSLQRSRAVTDAGARHGLGDMIRFARFLRSGRYGVVNLHYGDVFVSLKDVLAVRLSGRRRCILSVHQVRAWEEAGPRKRRLTGLAGRLSDGVIVTSEAMAALMLEAGIPRGKIRQIEPGVVDPTCRMPREVARTRLGLRQEALVVLSVARLVEHKHVDHVVEACGRLVDSGEDVELVIAGDGLERERLEAIANERLSRRTTFLGHMSDPETAYAAADVFCLPSRVEAFGLVYVEAALRSLPSVGVDVGGVGRAIRNGETGFVVEAGNIDQITQVLGRLLRDGNMRRRFGEAARAYALANFGVDRMVDEYRNALLGQR
jgi:glycosyltransferase involved in cell wall biosynthesis